MTACPFCRGTSVEPIRRDAVRCIDCGTAFDARDAAADEHADAEARARRARADARRQRFIRRQARREHLVRAFAETER